ncbi:curved DNA-binding protein [Grosmannia clavigera kw1407]|uniref:Curved DNA-binding protein n=1 Tax=Grosmannia clavigera (strain kw1407 / UAMH 11150) TaxID=655863 RepID=F0XPW2_GROCL|nr:curved DNA-binding protein [Grosmannia clavigera kw1407]EFX00371.1 curved DNA-binding protein [Grosmannia clavigera kw1407]
MAPTEEKEADYSLNNPDTLTKYKSAAQISETVLAAVSELCVAGAKIVDICEKGDVLIAEELAKVFRGKKVNKGFSHPTTVSPSSFVTPYTPLRTDESEANAELVAGEAVKIQLGAQIDGFGSIVCDTVIVPGEDKTAPVTGRQADLILATYYANELLLRLMLPAGLLAAGTDEERVKAAAAKPITQTRMTALLDRVAKAYDCSLVENTTSWLFGHDEIEGKKKIILAPGEGSRGEGVPEVGEVWGVEIGLSAASGKVKQLEQRATLHRRTAQTLRQLDDERDAKSGVVECVRGGVFRQYEVVGDKDGAPVGRLLTTIAITKNGITKLGSAPALDLEKVKSDKKITDEEVLKILEQPLARNTGNKNKNKKKKKPTKTEEGASE